MHIYRCAITLMEATFFSSREISALYQTEPLIGNYALAYAFGFCQSDYFNDGTIHYKTHLSALNERGVYLTPAAVRGVPAFLLRRFNAQTDGHWSAYGAGVIVGRSDHGWSRKEGMHWFTFEGETKPQRHNPTNRPQAGRIRMMAVGTRLIAYVLSRDTLILPRYIRLGKFLSKAIVTSESVHYEVVQDTQQAVVNLLLNPADLPATSALRAFDLVNIPPTPLVNNALIDGDFYKVSGEAQGTPDWLPYGMQFNVEQLP